MEAASTHLVNLQWFFSSLGVSVKRKIAKGFQDMGVWAKESRKPRWWFQIFFILEDFRFDLRIFFRWVGDSTTNQKRLGEYLDLKGGGPRCFSLPFCISGVNLRFRAQNQLREDVILPSLKLSKTPLKMVVSNTNLLFQGAPIFRGELIVSGWVCYFSYLNPPRV